LALLGEGKGGGKRKKKKKVGGKKKKKEKKIKRGRNFRLGQGSNRGKFNLEVFSRVTPYQGTFCLAEN